MDDRLARVESEVHELAESVARMERRLTAIEHIASQLPVQAFASDLPALPADPALPTGPALSWN